jgi:hypothetical protein
MKKAICIICHEELGVSKCVDEKTYTCYACDQKMRRGEKINLKKKKPIRCELISN